MLSEKSIKKFDEENVVGLYQSGMSFAEISQKLKTGYNQLHQYFIVKGITARRAVRRKTLRPKAPIGKTFGLWTVVSEEVKAGSELGYKDRILYWLVQCKCGHLAWKNPVHLKNGTSTRCKRCGNKTFIDGDKEFSIEALILSKYNQIVSNLPTRKKCKNLEFSITPKDISELYEKQNHLCALSGIDLSIDLTKKLQQQNLSVDRIDSNIGYTKDNIQLVDKRINMMKGTLDNEEFINLCCKVAEQNGYHKKISDETNNKSKKNR